MSSNRESDHQPSAREQRYSLRENVSIKAPKRYRESGEEDFIDQNTSYGYIRERRRTSSRQTPKHQPNAEVDMKMDEKPEIAHGDYQAEVVNEQDFNYVPQETMNMQPYRYAPVPPPQPAVTIAPAERFGPQGTELSDDLKNNLRKLKNVLKLPKARRFVFCEFFYSGVDQQLFLAENEFSQLMKESFPNLKCNKLRKQEWREVRRLIGKPRRCSQTFLNEERESLEAKRQKIRTIYNGTCTALGQEAIDLPAFLPRPPVVGMKIYARVRSPKDGIYAGTVDAVLSDGYRVVFDKEEMIPPCIIKDFEVMYDQPAELLAINYFLEMNRANIRGAAKMPALSHLYPTPTYIGPDGLKKTGMMVVGMGDATPVATASGYPYGVKKTALGKDEKVGNFPVRMLVILVKLCKVIEYKKQLVSNLTWMNDNAEKMNLITDDYPHEFKVQYSQLVLDIEYINKLFKTYLNAIQSYHETLIPHLNEPQPTDRPLALRKTTDTHAFQLVKHCNNELHVRNKKILQLITSLVSILLQLRTIGAQKKRYTACDLNLLSDSLKQIRSQILPTNAATFQDCIEVHMKQIHKMMMRTGI